MRTEGSFFSVAITTPFFAARANREGEKDVSAERLCQTFRGGFRKRGVREPLTPSEVAPEATALSAYSICTSLPEGLKVVSEKE